jgi:hypothetical protein
MHGDACCRAIAGGAALNYWNLIDRVVASSAPAASDSATAVGVAAPGRQARASHSRSAVMTPTLCRAQHLVTAHEHTCAGSTSLLRPDGVRRDCGRRASRSMPGAVPTPSRRHVRRSERSLQTRSAAAAAWKHTFGCSSIRRCSGSRAAAQAHRARRAAAGCAPAEAARGGDCERSAHLAAAWRRRGGAAARTRARRSRSTAACTLAAAAAARALAREPGGGSGGGGAPRPSLQRGTCDSSARAARPRSAP